MATIVPFVVISFTCMMCGRAPREPYKSFMKVKKTDIHLVNQLLPQLMSGYGVPPSCRDCGGEWFADTDEVPVRVENYMKSDEEDPRKGRPPNWLREQRRLAKENEGY